VIVRGGDFYEDDEPVEKIIQAFENGVPCVTVAPDDPSVPTRWLYLTPRAAGKTHALNEATQLLANPDRTRR